jgi:hypothetical protein
MNKGLFALLLAGTFMVPHIIPALGNDITVGVRVQEPQSQAQSWEASRIAPVPHLEAMSRLTSDWPLRGLKVRILLGPEIETLGPFLVAPSIPPKQSFSEGAMTE